MSDDSIPSRMVSDHYGPGTPCSQCGTTLGDDAPGWTEYCERHKGRRWVFELGPIDAATVTTNRIDAPDLWAAYVAGFMQSAEGHNAEHPHGFDEDAIRHALRDDFEEWVGDRLAD